MEFLAPAFENGNKGLSIWQIPSGFQVSVKKASGGFEVTVAPTLQEALQKALAQDEDLL